MTLDPQPTTGYSTAFHLALSECPRCGYCPCCGRDGVWYYPTYPPYYCAGDPIRTNPYPTHPTSCTLTCGSHT